MHYLPSKKIIWFVLGIIAVEGFFIFSHKNDGFFKEGPVSKPELTALKSVRAPIFFRDPNTSTKVIAEVVPTDDVLNYLSQIGRSVAEGAQQISMPSVDLTIPPPHYALYDLTRVETNESSIRRYMVSIFIILESGATDVDETDVLGTINRFVEENDPRDLETLSSVSKIERVRSEALAAIEVPDALADMHLELVNNIYAAASALEGIRETTTNPHAGFLAAATYANFKSKQAQTIIALSQQYDQYASITSQTTAYDSE